MELCDESLTAFLERSPGPLSYHIQVNISHDMALALVYLHSNGLIHRDLTGNNVLMIAGPQAKITDFGMSKLASVNPRMTALTLCPGNILYMSPEALDEAKAYTAKLDIFSFGVTMIQIVTRQFPNPSDRFHLVHSSEFNEEIRRVVPETERREADLKLILDTHSLKPLALQCLKKKENERPSAVQLSERLSELKQSSQYRESMHQTQSSSDIQQLQQQLQDQRILTEAKTREIQEHEARIIDLENNVEDKNRQLQRKERQLEEKQCTVQIKERELHETEERLQASEQLVSELQQSLRQKDITITDLQQTISEPKRKIQRLEQHDTASRHQPQQQSFMRPRIVRVQRNIMTWRDGENAPENMSGRACAAAQGNTAYFAFTAPWVNPCPIMLCLKRNTASGASRVYSKTYIQSQQGNSAAGASRVYSYKIIQGQEEWCRLLDNPKKDFGLAVIDGLVTSVGGGGTNTLLSLTGEGESQQWSEIFPHMSQHRDSAACVNSKQALVVAGGHTGHSTYVPTVEVMDISTKVWTTVCHLPRSQSELSGIVCGDTVYLAGGSTRYGESSHLRKCVFACSLSDLLKSLDYSEPLFSREGKTDKNVWKEVSSLPVVGSTLASVNGNLLAIGGEDDASNHATAVWKYAPHTDSWSFNSHMKNKRSRCLAVTLPEDRLIVVGGYTLGHTETDSVEIFSKH